MVRNLITESRKALESNDVRELRDIAVKAIDEAAVDQRRDLILIALIDYALSKMMSKGHYSGSLDRDFKSKIDVLLKNAEANPASAVSSLEKIANIIIKLDEAEGHYSDNIIEKAKLKYASKLYYKGLSLKMSAELTGAEEAELMSYIGRGKIHELNEDTVKNKLKFARKLLK